MKASEKAIQLVERIYDKLEDVGCIPHLVYKDSKQCALICVDEILNDNPNIYDSDRLNHKYWKQVELEINKL